MREGAEDEVLQSFQKVRLERDTLEEREREKREIGDGRGGVTKFSKSQTRKRHSIRKGEGEKRVEGRGMGEGRGGVLVRL